MSPILNLMESFQFLPNVGKVRGDEINYGWNIIFESHDTDKLIIPKLIFNLKNIVMDFLQDCFNTENLVLFKNPEEFPESFLIKFLRKYTAKQSS